MNNKKNEENKFSFSINYADSEIKSIATVIVKGSYICKTENSTDTNDIIINSLKSSIVEYINLNDIKKLNRLQSEKNDIINYAINKIKIHGIELTKIKIDSIDYDDETKNCK